MTIFAPSVPRLASRAHITIARVQCSPQPCLLWLIEIPYFGPSIDTRLVYPANGIVFQFAHSDRTAQYAR